MNQKNKAKRKKFSGVFIGAVIMLLLVALIEVPLAIFFLRPVSEEPSPPEDVPPTVTCDFSTPWHEQYRVITHALGTVDGRIGTNSLEAFCESYEHGARVFEADFSLTADGYLVVRHDFTSTSFWNLEQTMDENMFYSDYINAKIGYFYTPLDIDDMLELMKEYPDTYLVTDTKTKDEEQVKETFRRFSEALNRADDESLRQRIIIQIYNYEMYEWVKDFVPDGNYVFTLYQMQNRDYDAVGAFCAEHSIPVVTVEQDLVTEDSVSTLHGYGVKVYINTLNKISDMLKLQENIGVDGFYSDYITPTDYQTVRDTKNTEDEDNLSYGEY